MSYWGQFQALNDAMDEAEEARRAFERQSNRLAGTLARMGLRYVTHADALRDLKRELRGFDITTGKWK